MFNSARLKLTGWYLLIIMSISIIFSSIIYRGLMTEVYRFEKAQRFRFQERIEEDIIIPNGQGPRLYIVKPMAINEELIEETRNRILIMLMAVNSGIFIVSGMLGYVLAGRTLQPIKDMMDEQNRFISDASHEFRTPLTSLKTAFEVFLRDKKADLKEARSVITESIEEVNKLQSLSDSLLQLSQYEKPNGYSNFSKIQFHSVVEVAIQSVSKIAKQKKIDIIYEKKEIEIVANKYGLIDLLVILLDNAIKYSPPNSNIKVSLLKKDSKVEITVQDHGIGIDKRDLEHIFERFYRADSARSKTKESGYGLGLSIVKKIVKLHKGSIKVESVVKKGTTFIILLPLNNGPKLSKSF